MRSSIRARPGCASDATPPAAWMMPATSRTPRPRLATNAGPPAPVNIRRPSRPDQPVERIVAARGLAAGDERVGKRRAADTAPRSHGDDHRLDVEGASESLQPLGHVANAADAIGALRFEELGE